MNCRGCATPLSLPLIDLGTAPPSNAYLRAEQLLQAEQWVPLKVMVCQHCWLVQTEDHAGREALFEQLLAQQVANGAAVQMASTLEIDAVIDPADTRHWLVRGLASARVGPLVPGRFIDTW